VTDKLDEYDKGKTPDPDDISVLATLKRKPDAIPDWMKPRDVFMRHLHTLISAGFDTTANLLTWSQYFLSHYPAVQQKLRDEILSTFGKDGKITIERLESLKYMNCFIKEALRLRPSGIELPRVLAKDLDMEYEEHGEMHKVHLPRGTRVSYSIYTAHQHPENFKDRPEEFDPERYMVDPNGGAVSTWVSAATMDEGVVLTWVGFRYCTIGFSYGPRRCLGERLALTEARWILAEIVRKFEVLPVEGWKYEASSEGNMVGLGD